MNITVRGSSSGQIEMMIYWHEYIPSESIIALHSIDVCIPFLALNLIWVGSPISNIYARWHDTDIMQRIQYFANL